jgi:hypothetical protein
MNELSDNTSSDRDAYLKAQKQRNLFIGLGLAVFVILVFFISMSRMAEGLRKGAEMRAAGKAAMAASASASHE